MKLRDVRLARLMSINHLAVRAGVSYSTVAKFERGQKPVRMEPVCKIATALDVPPSFIDEFQALVGTPDEAAARVLPDDGMV